MPRRVTQSAESLAPMVGDDLDLTFVDEIVLANDAMGSLIPILQQVQDRFGYLPEPVVNEISAQTGVPVSRIYGVITFYAQFSTEPSGRHKVCVCHGTACHVAGAVRLTEALEQEIGVNDGCTTEDMEFTLDSVACLGACSQAPVMRIDEESYGNLTPDSTRKAIREVMTSLGLTPLGSSREAVR